MAQAKSPIGDKADAKCFGQAIRTLGPSVITADYNFVGGTEGNDFDFQTTEGQPDVICGFGGRDTTGTLEAGDIFLGGKGDDFLRGNDGTFYGGEGDDEVTAFNDGTFNGGEGDDEVNFNSLSGTFNGEAGNDRVSTNSGTVNGGEGIDSVTTNNGTISNVEQGDV